MWIASNGILAWMGIIRKIEIAFETNFDIKLQKLGFFKAIEVKYQVILLVSYILVHVFWKAITQVQYLRYIYIFNISFHSRSKIERADPQPLKIAFS